jgi:glycosyltransferase involved in cell wall biosynthesis
MPDAQIIAYNAVSGFDAARNQAIESSKSKFLTFYEAGDVLDLDVVAKAIVMMEANNLDLIVCGQMNFDVSDQYFSETPKLFLSGQQVTKLVLKNDLLASDSIWSKIYRSSYLIDKAIRFCKKSACIDKKFVWMCYVGTEKIGIIPEIFYGRRLPKIHAQKHDLGKLFSSISAYNEMRDVLMSAGLIRCFAKFIINVDLCSMLHSFKCEELSMSTLEVLKNWIVDLQSTDHLDLTAVVLPENRPVFDQCFPNVNQIRPVEASGLTYDFWTGRQVAVVDPGLINPMGHHQNFDYKIAQELYRQGARVTLYSHQAYTIPADLRTNFTIVPLFTNYPYHSEWLGSTEIKEVRQFENLSKTFQHEFASVLDTHDAFVFPSIFPYQIYAVGMLNTEKHVFGITHNSPTNPKFDGFGSWTRALDAICDMKYPPQIGLVEEMLHHELDGLFRHSDPLHILPYPVFEPKRINQSTSLRLIGLFGSHRQEQGLRDVNRIISTILSCGLEVLVHDVGNRVNTKDRKGVHKIGHVDDLAEAMSICDAVVINYDLDYYRHMGSGIAWDALSAGVPVLCSRGIAAAKMLQKFGACELFSNGDMRSLNEGLQRTKANYARIITHTHEGRLRMMEEHGICQLISKIGKILADRVPEI